MHLHTFYLVVLRRSEKARKGQKGQNEIEISLDYSFFVSNDFDEFIIHYTYITSLISINSK